MRYQFSTGRLARDPNRFLIPTTPVIFARFRGMVICAFAVVALTASAVAQVSSPTAKFSWAMPEHFGQMKNGVVDYHWNPKDQTYDPDYLNPQSWKVNFNACASTGNGGIRAYSWTIDGKLVTTITTCSFIHEFKNLGDHQVKLTVTDANSQTGTEELTVPVTDYLIVSIGDSIAAGEGVPDIPKGEPGGARWIYTRCHRSARAGHALAALALERDDPKTSVTFISFACSGAELRGGLAKSQKKGLRDIPAQMDQVKRIAKIRRIDALLITAGGNDANFSRLVAKAIFKDDASHDEGTLKLYHKGIGVLRDRFAGLNDDISTIFWRPKVFITQYPDISHKTATTFCNREPKHDRLRNIESSEAQWASQTVVKELNDKIAEAADQFGWTLVNGIAPAFFEHGYCAAVPWVNTFTTAKETQGTTGCTKSSLIHCIVSAGSLHPNYAGQKFYAERLTEALRENGFGPTPLP